MCGLAGVLSTDQLDHNSLSEFWDSKLASRGPDSIGCTALNKDGWEIYLRHWRLAILGIGSEGHQPMRSENGRFTLLFNGEIYNFIELVNRHGLVDSRSNSRFTSDSAVLLAMWEKYQSEALNYFQGMFSFAIFDHDSSELTLVRDQFGIKPLYFSASNTYFAFASDPAILWNELSQINQETIASFMLFDRYDIAPSTFVDNVESIRPGHLLTVKLYEGGKLSLERQQWFDPTQIKILEQDYEDAIVTTKRLFLEAVKAEMISDVPIAFALSGGIDSSSIICAARHLYPNAKLTAFTYAPPDSMGEIEWAQLVANYVNAELVIVQPSQKELSDVIGEVIQAQREPIDHTRFLAQYFVFREVKKHGFKVLLEGQGADEILGGYFGFPSARIVSALKRGDWGDFLSLLKGYRSRNFFRLLNDLASAFYQMFGPYFSERHKKKLYAMLSGNNLKKLIDAESNALSKWLNRDDLAIKPAKNWSHYNLTLMDATFNSLLPRLLRHGDRNAMAHSVENRVPFLFQPFAFHCLQLNEKYLYRGGQDTKFIFREALREIVPDEILDRKDKVGFTHQVVERDDFGSNVPPGLPVRIDLRGEAKMRRWLLTKWFDFFRQVAVGQKAS